MLIDDPDFTGDLQFDAKLAALRAAIDEGEGSDMADGDFFARVRKTLKPPTTSR